MTRRLPFKKVLGYRNGHSVLSCGHFAPYSLATHLPCHDCRASHDSLRALLNREDASYPRPASLTAAGEVRLGRIVT